MNNTSDQSLDKQKIEPRGSNRRFHIIATTVTILIMFFMVWGTVYMRSRTHFQDGERYFEKDELIQAITSYESAAHAYTPWNKNVSRSLERLWEIGEILEDQHNDPTYPLVAYRSLRSSVYAIRSFYLPYKEWVPLCDAKINILVNKQRSQLEMTDQGNLE